MSGNLETMTIGMKRVLWVMGACRQLRIWGLIGGPEVITSKGLAIWDQLDIEWCPMDEDIEAVLQHAATDQESQAGIFTLLKEFRDNRERLQSYVEVG